MISKLWSIAPPAKAAAGQEFLGCCAVEDVTGAAYSSLTGRSGNVSTVVASETPLLQEALKKTQEKEGEFNDGLPETEEHEKPGVVLPRRTD